MNLAKLEQQDLLARCAWCHRHISPDEECFGAGSRVWPGIRSLVRRQAGKVIPLTLTGGCQVIAIVSTADSPARAEGYDLYFQACSEKCCAELSAAVRAEMPGEN